MYQCSITSTSGVPYCPAQQGSAASKQGLHAAYIWSSTACTSTYCTDGGKAYRTWLLDGKSWVLSGFCATTWASTGDTYFGSVRCGFRIIYLKRHTAGRVQLLKHKWRTALSRGLSCCSQAGSVAQPCMVFYALQSRCMYRRQ